jgi:simple sugar transport system ATP-binding protein
LSTATIAAPGGPTAAAPPPAIECRGVSKRFGHVLANDAVDLVVRRGSIHGVIGENGAGKSTLMAILHGFHPADSGEILVDGQKVTIRDSADASRLGIEMVHQHFMLVEPFTALENVMLGAEGGALLAKGTAAARQSLARLAADYGLVVDPDARVMDLPVGARQRVEILKALYRGAEVLILDEPTGVLTPQEADDLFRVLRALRDEGKAVLLITHKLREVMAVTDRVSVMRGGRMVAHRDTAATSAEELGELMIGRRPAAASRPAPTRPGPEILAVEELRVRDGAGAERVRGVSLTLHAGEILGIAGVAGNGQTELLEALAGMRAPEAGTIRLRGEPIVQADAAQMRRLGVAHVPEDRLRHGLVTEFEACESAILGYHHDKAWRRLLGLFSGRAVQDHTAQLMATQDVRPALPRLRSSLFSGGNQQKLILAREMARAPDILLVGQPTRGVDIGGIEAIHQRLRGWRQAGKAVLMVSVELDEILALADRILVMFDGRIVGELPGGAADERRLGLLMAGAEG